MSSALIVRIVGAAVLGVVGWWVWEWIGDTPDFLPWGLSATIAGVAVGAAATPYFTTVPLRLALVRLRLVSASAFLAGTAGLVLGLVVAALISIPLARISGWPGIWVPVALSALLGFLGVAVAVSRGYDLRRILPDTAHSSAPFMTLATQNPIEQEGTYPLPEAQLDRFLLKILIRYPDAEHEVELVRQVTSGQVGEVLDVATVETVVARERVLAMQRCAARVLADDRISDYAVRMVRATRSWPGIAIGAGPRGGIALIRSARARALLAGRDFVIPDDVKAMSLPALRHRISLTPELEIEGHGPDDVLSAVVDSVEAPRT